MTTAPTIETLNAIFPADWKYLPPGVDFAEHAFGAEIAPGEIINVVCSAHEPVEYFFVCCSKWPCELTFDSVPDWERALHLYLQIRPLLQTAFPLETDHAD